MKRCIAVLFSILIFLPIAGRSQQQSQRTIYGAGADGKWLAARKSGDWYSDGQWILGYLSALNHYATVQPRHTDADAVAVWVDNYCQVRPLVDVSDAAEALATELGTKW